MTDRAFDDFDAYAANYREIHSKNISLSGAESSYFAEMKVAFLKKFEKNTPLKVLDVGCGDGLTELYFEKHFYDFKLTGIDVSKKSIEVAKERDLVTASFSHYNGRDIPFSDNSFELVFVAGVFHHINFALHHSLLLEINRVLKKGGRLYFFEHNPINPLTKYLVKTCVFDEDAKLLPHQYSKKILKKVLFNIVNTHFIIFLPRMPWLKRLWGIEKYLEWLPIGGQYLIRAQKL